MKCAVPLMLLGVNLVGLSVQAAPIGSYNQIMQTVYMRNEAELKYLISIGLNVNATNMQGKTALCSTVENQDYQGYELLLSQGATVRTPCMRDMNPEVLARFKMAQPPLGSYYKGAALVGSRNMALTVGAGKEVATTIGSLPFPHLGEILLGGVAVGTAFAIGVHGSSGGGDDPDPDPKNNYVYTAPLNLDYKSFEDAEYSGSDISEYKSIDFLNKLNASKAYARGYTGYKVSRDSQGNLVPLTDAEQATDTEKYITNKKIKVAIVDDGLFYNSDLNENLFDRSIDGYTKSIGKNYVYGVESSANNKNYWKYDNNTIATLYLDGASSEKQIIMGSTKEKALAYWNEYAGKFAPVCGGSNTTNCLFKTEKEETLSTVTDNKRYKVYYLSSYSPEKTYADDSDQVLATYYIYSDFWDQYNAKYGATGYVYASDDATGTFFQTLEQTEKGSYYYSTIDHGTHVAGIIGALRNGEGMQGVAYNAEIVPVKADLSMMEDIDHISDVITAYPDLKIINLSIGPEGDKKDNYTSNNATDNESYWDNWRYSNYLSDSFSAAKKENVALIIAAGNGDSDQKGLPQSSIFSAAPLVDSAYKNLLINVISLGNNNKIASYSNRCGATASYCLAAFGGDSENKIVSTGISADKLDDYTGKIGTSQATPMVSGSLAVLKGAFPFLTTQQAVQILFDTADYITPTQKEIDDYNNLSKSFDGSENAYAVNTVEGKYNSIYGRGLVNLDKATDPIGLPKISFDTIASSPNSVLAGVSSAQLSSSVANTLEKLPKNLIVLDDYSRAYQMPMKKFIKTEKRSDSLRRSFRSFMAQNEKEVNASDVLSFAFSEAPADKKNVQTGSMSMMVRPNKNLKMRFNFTEDTASFGGTYAERTVQNPFMNMRQAFGTEASFKFAESWALTGSWMMGKNGFIDEDVFDKMNKQPRMQLIESGVAYKGIKNLTLGISGGIMNEEESLLGMRGTGAFKTEGAKTNFVRVVANYQPMDKFRLTGSYTYGMTDANKVNALMQFSQLKSDSFALTAEYLLDEKQTFGIKLVSPLRVRSGSASFNLPVARDLYDDRIYREIYTAGLKPSAREYDLSLFYANDISSDLSLAGETGVRLNPDHQKDVEPDYRALFKLNWTW